MTEEKAESLSIYIRSLSDFSISEPEYPYDHMGATITDAMLQAGLNYKNVVEPRVNKLLKNYPEARTTSGFSGLLGRVGVNELLSWQGSEKPERILGVVRFFIENGIETEKDLKAWLRVESNRAELRKIRGVGNKTLDYFGMLSGIPGTAIDRHLTNFLKRAGIQARNYSEAKAIINKTADVMGIGKSTLDYSIWKHMSDGKKDSCDS